MIISTVVTGVATAVVGGTAAVYAAPVVLGIIGFTKVGIVAGSIASAMMSSAAVAGGGGVAAGSAVAVCQSIAATGGLGAIGNVAAGATGAFVGAVGGWLVALL